MTISFPDLEQLWINAGGPASAAPIAAAIAQAESYGGDPTAYNAHDSNGLGGTQVSAGLWQISNQTMTPIANWSDPATNAAAAVAKYNGAGGRFSPWGTFTSGAYVAFLQDAVAHGLTTAAAASSATGAGSAAGTATAPAAAASTFAPAALSPQATTIIIVFAAIVLLIGIWAMTRSSAPAEAVPA